MKVKCYKVEQKDELIIVKYLHFKRQAYQILYIILFITIYNLSALFVFEAKRIL